MKIKAYWNEEWRAWPYKSLDNRRSYMVSNYGRLAGFHESFEKDGILIKTQYISGYEAVKPAAFSKYCSMYVHRIVAEVFLEKREEEEYLLHLDYNKQNNQVSNLKWVTKAEWQEHFKNNPNVVEAREKKKKKHAYRGHKLTETQVRLIKKKIKDPNRKNRMKMIAKQFNISEMQLYRIKSGENWGHVVVD